MASTPALRRLSFRDVLRPYRRARSARRGVIMRSALARWLMVALAGFGSTPAVARHSRAYRSVPRERIQPPQPSYLRPPATTLRPADDGIIHWNTPNKDGNLGGPGAGGGGGPG